MNNTPIRQQRLWPCNLDIPILGKTVPMTTQNFFNLAYLQYRETELKLTCNLWWGIIIMYEVVVIAVPKPLLTDIALIVY